MRNKKIKQQIINAECAILIAILAQFTIPLGPVPLTGQTFAIGLIATLLSPLNSTITVFIYLLLGTIGLPVFAGAHAGIGVLFGPTGGYLLAFLLQAYVTSKVISKKNTSYPRVIVANLVGALVSLALGTVWLKFQLDLTWVKAFAVGFTPFVIGGVIKAIAASILGILLNQRLPKRFLSQS